jgi:hypothetical protein
MLSLHLSAVSDSRKLAGGIKWTDNQQPEWGTRYDVLF